MNIGAYLTTADIGAYQLVPAGGGGGTVPKQTLLGIG
jgi:hypothetical protein